MGDLEDRDPPLSHRPLSLFSQTFTGLGALALVVLVVVRLAGQGAPLTLLSTDGRRTLPISVIGDQPFVALADAFRCPSISSAAPSRRFTMRGSISAVHRAC
jgi:hypothetical protein